MNLQDRIDNLNRLILDDRLLRHAWTDTEADGRERACLLAAIAPETGKVESASACPAELMPAFLAHLTPRIDDNGSVDSWPAMVRQYARLAATWHVLSHEAWLRVEYGFRASCVIEARQYTTDAATLTKCQAAIDFCRAEAPGLNLEYPVGTCGSGTASQRAWDRLTQKLFALIEGEVCVVQ